MLGKSTAISILTGTLKPTAGSALVKNIDITEDIEQARTFMGICPQYNVLYEMLSPLEHLKFFAQASQNVS